MNSEHIGDEAGRADIGTAPLPHLATEDRLKLGFNEGYAAAHHDLSQKADRMTSEESEREVAKRASGDVK